MFNLRSLDLNLLTVFEAIYEVGTVSGAADRLALSQSATSHALARLRDTCGDDLFVRAHQGLSPTPTAREMYPAIKQALDALRDTLAEASGFDPGTARRRFRISIPHPMGPFYLLALRAAVAGSAPNVVLSFDTVSRPLNLEENLRDGIVDVAIDWLPVEQDPFINGRLFDDRLVLLVRRGHPLVDLDISIEDLRKAEFVTLHHRRETDHAPMAIREFMKLGMRETVHVSELLEIPTVVASTDLVGVFAESMSSLMAERLGLRILPALLDLPPVPIYLIWHEARRHDAAHRWLRDFVAAELGRIVRRPDPRSPLPP
jgi:LysR family transcriptional regulator, transcriptional activator for leuABCD operon